MRYVTQYRERMYVHDAVYDQFLDGFIAGRAKLRTGEQRHGFHNGFKLSGTGGEDGKYGIENYL